ncbi:ead/Ea22-like family protein, partial [Escherichia coli]|nr:ead/Ea22-like family protein [Escherichia coli]MED8792089.1 ead/Ea22-like family protein [Escherichia coli]
YYGVIADSGMNGNYYIALCSGPDKRANKRFIAAANPATVLALLDEREAQSKRIAELEANLAALAAENAGLNKFIVQSCYVFDGEQDELSDAYICAIDGRMPQTPATDAFLAEVKTEARKEGAYFVANRMLAAWEAGFIDDTAKNAADIARMILTSTEFMANAPEGDFDRSFSDGVLEDIAEQLRKGGKQ